MDMIRYEYVWYFNLLFIIIPIALITYVGRRSFRSKLRSIFSNNMVEKLGYSSSKRKRNIKSSLLVTALIFLTIALVNPQIGTKQVEAKREGIDIILAVDLSRSMLAEDITPNRLMKTKYEIKRFIERLKGDRVGLVGFTSKAFIQCPLTTDYGAMRMFLDILKPNLLPQNGTSISEAVKTSISAFDQKDKKRKLLIVISDGEDHEQGLEEAIAEAKENNIVIFTIGIGSTLGVPIPYKGGFLKDENGETVITKLNELTLQKVALESDGQFYRASAGDSELDEIFKEISEFEKREYSTKIFEDFESRFQVFILIALIILLIESLLNKARKEK
ncbi:MAG: hypothetical protein CR982_01880 [Candidatus Cloacimonadota bacterium]|nr:MAG: hypothetical protein CR982_01880 [Candidatus Cloacimonadota bacterium]PIE78902.1 MAG: hypothetical protein CSA15_05475 [Candidatus Delongbacteria bacterium]